MFTKLIDQKIRDGITTSFYSNGIMCFSTITDNHEYITHKFMDYDYEDAFYMFKSMVATRTNAEGDSLENNTFSCKGWRR
jgi:hypothetical protein